MSESAPGPDARVPDPLEGLAPGVRRAVRARFLQDARARLRDLLATASADDRATMARLADGLAADAAAVGLERPRAAALELAHAAESGGQLGAAVLALTRAVAEASA